MASQNFDPLNILEPDSLHQILNFQNGFPGMFFPPSLQDIHTMFQSNILDMSNLINMARSGPFLVICQQFIKTQNLSNKLQKFVESKFSDIPEEFKYFILNFGRNYIESAFPELKEPLQLYFDDNSTVSDTIKNCLLSGYNTAALDKKIYFPNIYRIDSLINNFVNNPESILTLQEDLQKLEISFKSECENSSAKIQAAWRGYKYRKDHLHNPHDFIGSRYLKKRAIEDCDSNLFATKMPYELKKFR